MKLGVCLNPAHAPGTPVTETAAWDVQVVQWAEELGYSEVWFGEHLTVPWEGCPAPDLLIAQALKETSEIRLGPASFNLPLHHPSMAAHRIAYLDHLSGGRLNLGIGASGTLTDWQLFGIDGLEGENREMTWESLDAILRLWNDPEPFESQGAHWTVNKPAPLFDGKLAFHLTPLQDPGPPISISGLSPESPSLKVAGERGYAPLCLAFGGEYLRGQWATVEAGAAAAGKSADRNGWGIVYDVFVAETDEEAVDLCLDSGVGQYLREFWLPLMADVGLIAMYKGDPEMSDSEVTADYFLRNAAIVGSVDTVVEKVEAAQAETGGFGTLIQGGQDFRGNPEPMRASMELLAKEVLPRVNGGRS
ncbi:MAG TPA: LLM class flavin-dependent oxidoreductase [Solirubrobacterales bacterium]|nr:LLM class flavin-dependent oxidoreductase [Solirubrobacterales bacterium]